MSLMANDYCRRSSLTITTKNREPNLEIEEVDTFFLVLCFKCSSVITCPFLYLCCKGLLVFVFNRAVSRQGFPASRVPPLLNRPSPTSNHPEFFMAIVLPAAYAQFFLLHRLPFNHRLSAHIISFSRYVPGDNAKFLQPSTKTMGNWQKGSAFFIRKNS